MRESLLSSNVPKSSRWKNLKPRAPLIIRSLVSDQNMAKLGAWKNHKES